MNKSAITVLMRMFAYRCVDHTRWLRAGLGALITLIISPSSFAGGNGIFTTPANNMQIRDSQDFLVVLKNFSTTEAFPYLIFILWVLVICGGIGCLLKGNSEYNKTGDVTAALKSIAIPAVMVCLGGILAWYVSSINSNFDF